MSEGNKQLYSSTSTTKIHNTEIKGSSSVQLTKITSNTWQQAIKVVLFNSNKYTEQNNARQNKWVKWTKATTYINPNWEKKSNQINFTTISSVSLVVGAA